MTTESNQITRYDIFRLEISYFRQLNSLHRFCLPETLYGNQSYREFLDSDFYVTYGCITSDNILIGFLISTNIGSEGDLVSIGVDSEFRGQGVGMKLLTHFLSYNKFDKIFLEVAVDNVFAIHLYTKCGFEKVGTRKKYSANAKGQYVDSYIMRKCFT